MNKRTIIIACIVLAFVIGLITLHLVQPAVSYALCELFCGGSFALGAVAGYLAKGHIN